MRRKATRNFGEATSVAAFPSRLGWMAARWRLGRLRALVFGARTSQAALHRLGAAETSPAARTAAMCQIIDRLQRFAAGVPDSFLDLDLDLDDRTEFQRRVVWHCRRIPRGQTLTYGQLAAHVQRPAAARAVGAVMATNRIPLIVPCHRVVGAGGQLGGYSAPGGLRLKRKLLHLEGGAGER